MRFILAIFIILALILGFLTYQNRFVTEEKAKELQQEPTRKKTVTSSKDYKSQEILFVPYWTLSSEDNFEDFESLAYFGIAVNKEGINKEETGFINLKNFLNASKGKENFLVVRMLDSEIINHILQNETSRKKVISESINIARANNFSGIILDLEFSAIPFESVIKRVTNFYKEFYIEARKNDLEFSSLLYGDTYFRGRPYQVSEIGKNADKIYVMAYDFHKARGNPGPNFPLNKNNKYDYDFKEMIEDFKSDVPAEKLVTVFGMFGYDWKVDNQGRGKEIANPRTTYQAEAFMRDCLLDKSCKTDRINETRILYESEDEKHEVWFEDTVSVREKIKYLNSQGLNSLGFWANSFWNSKLSEE